MSLRSRPSCAATPPPAILRKTRSAGAAREIADIIRPEPGQSSTRSDPQWLGIGYPTQYGLPAAIAWRSQLSAAIRKD
jgi:hypothetical protein